MASIAPISGNLTEKEAVHLLRRCTFGPTKEEILSITGLSVSAALDELLNKPELTPSLPIDPKTGQTFVNSKLSEINSEEGVLETAVLAQWLEGMRTRGLDLREKMVHFWHTHFTTQKGTVSEPAAIYWQIELFRKFALGNYKSLAKKISLDNAMIVYLDSNSNVIGSPQENYAREFLELYTIGKGPQISATDYTNYTETDIKEAAKVLSGLNIDRTFGNIDPETNIPRGVIKTSNKTLPQPLTLAANQHVIGPKEFKGSLGNGGTTIQSNFVSDGYNTVEGVYEELDQLVEMIFAKDETAKYICRRLYRYFVHYEITPEIENDIITPLTITLKSNSFEILPVLRQLLSSQHFFNKDNNDINDDNRGAIIKSPWELMIGTLRFFNVSFGDMTDPTRQVKVYGDSVLRLYETLGVEVYEPFDVAGYDAYHQFPEYNRNWITVGNLGYRYQLADSLIEGLNDADDIPLNIKLDVMEFIKKYITSPANPDEIIDFLVDNMFPEIIKPERRDYFKNEILLDDLSVANWVSEWGDYLSTGDDSAVRPQLEALIREMIQSPEYQLF